MAGIVNIVAPHCIAESSMNRIGAARFRSNINAIAICLLSIWRRYRQCRRAASRQRPGTTTSKHTTEQNDESLDVRQVKRRLCRRSSILSSARGYVLRSVSESAGSQLQRDTEMSFDAVGYSGNNGELSQRADCNSIVAILKHN